MSKRLKLYYRAHGLLIIFLLLSTHRTAITQTSAVSFENASTLLDFEHRSSEFGGDGLAGTAWFDYDNDGWLDLFLPNGKPQPNALFRNNGDGTFTNVAAEAGVENGLGNSGVVAADFDNDGWKDLFLTGEGGSLQGTEMTPLKFYRNNGDGTFSDITEESGLAAPVTHLACSVADVDNDGYLDIFISAPGSLTHFRNDRNKLFHNNGDMTFTDISVSSRVNTSVGACATMFSDYNNDGFMDLFIANCNDRNLAATPVELFRNNGNRTFTNVAAQAGISRPGLWMGFSGADFDRDGDIDVFVTNTGAARNLHALWRNNGNGTFTDVAPSVGAANHEFGWGCVFTDFDNDGYDDLFWSGSLVGTCPPRAQTTSGAQRCLGFNIIGTGTGNPGTMLFNRGDGTFAELTSQMPVNLSNIYTSGVAQGDFDNDGFADMIVAAERVPSQPSRPGRPILLRNQGNGNNWLKIKLVGMDSNRDGVGARVRVTTGEVSQLKEIYAGSSHLSMDSQWLVFGVGQQEAVDELYVKWPSGIEDVINDLEVNQLVTVVEGSSVTSVENEPGQIPAKFVLKQNYPNPFNPSTIIRYELPEAVQVVLKIYNLAGAKVRTLTDELQSPGRHTVEWDATDDFGKRVASGTYFYRLHVQETISVIRKMVLIR